LNFCRSHQNETLNVFLSPISDRIRLKPKA